MDCAKRSLIIDRTHLVLVIGKLVLQKVPESPDLLKILWQFAFRDLLWQELLPPDDGTAEPELLELVSQLGLGAPEELVGRPVLAHLAVLGIVHADP